MFFVLSKVLAFLVIPSNIIIGLGIVGLALMPTRWRRAGVRLLVASFVLIVIVGLSPIGALMTAALENRFPSWKDNGAPVDGIVVLGGVIEPGLSVRRGTLAISGAVERITEAAALARRYPAARIVFTGGNPNLAGGPPEADFVLELFNHLGVPPERVTLEKASRNTAENASFTKELVKPKLGERWLLVTSAAHMPRSVGVFRKAQFAIEPYPVDWQGGGTVSLIRLPRRILGGLAAVDNASHEWVGLVAYWITGRTSELYPGPN